MALALVPALALAGNAAQIAGNSGTIYGEAAACGVDPAAIARADAATRTAIAQRSASEPERAEAIKLYERERADGETRQKRPAEAEDCTDVKNGFTTISRASTFMQFALPR